MCEHNLILKMSYDPSKHVRRRRSNFWLPISTPNSQAQSFNQRLDSESVFVNQLSEIKKSLEKGENKLRISQAYEGVGHTFGLEKIGDRIVVVHDHNEGSLYKSKGISRYNRTIDFLKKLGYKIEFAPIIKKALTDGEYQARKMTGDGACVYYFDKYVANWE